MVIISQTGGRILGQGTYGCVFTPPLVCKDRSKPKPDPTKLGKISQVQDVKHEIQAAKDLKGAPYSSYFILPEIDSLCVPAPMEQQKEPDIAKCEPIETYGTSKMVHYQMRYGGQSVHVVMRSQMAKAYSFVTFMRQMLEMGAVLVVNGYIHADFHTNNVLVTKGMEPRLIDFGKAFPAKQINQNLIDEMWTDYMPSFPYESPDASMMIATHSKHSLSECIEDIKREKQSVINVEQVLGVSRQAQMEELKDFWRNSRSVKNEDWVSYWKTFWPVNDAWAIGAILVDLLRRRLLSVEFAKGEWAQRHEIIEGVLRGLLHSSPRKRLDCLEALALFDPMNPIVTGIGRAWLEARRKT
jgi:hypothetical protein